MNIVMRSTFVSVDGAMRVFFAHPMNIIGDKACDSDAFIAESTSQGAIVVIPPRKSTLYIANPDGTAL